MSAPLNPNQLKMFMSGKELGAITKGVDVYGYAGWDPAYSKRSMRDVMKNKYQEGHTRMMSDDTSLNEHMDKHGVEKPVILYPHGEESGRGEWDKNDWQLGNGHHRAAWARRQGRLGRERYTPVIYDENNYHGAAEFNQPTPPWVQQGNLPQRGRTQYPSDEM